MGILIFLAGVAIGLFIGAATLLVIGSTAVIRERRKRTVTYRERPASNVVDDWHG